MSAKRSQSPSRSERAKRGGDRAEATVIQSIDALDSVSDLDVEHLDARTTAPLTENECAIEGAERCPANTPVEIKSVGVVYGVDSANGRFFIPEHQHDHLLDADGWYVFAVCTPDPNRDVLAMRAVPAEVVDDIVSSWIVSGDDRSEDAYAQFAWTRLFDAEEVAR